jgi:1,2-phenylacetyl-CoA epoxidase catalytic subunit
MTAFATRTIDAQHLPDEPAYRETLVRLLAAHALAEKATGLGFARVVAGVQDADKRERLETTQREEMAHARRIYELLADLGVDEADADAIVAGAWDSPSFDAPRVFATAGGDWIDALLAGFCLDTGGLLMIARNYAVSSYRPHAEAADAIVREESEHDAFAAAAFHRAIAAAGSADVQAKVDVWIPRGLNFFGPPRSGFTAACRAFGLKAHDNDELAQAFRRIVARRLHAVGLRMPALSDGYPFRVLGTSLG